MYGISSVWYASHSRASHLSRVLASAGASIMIGTSWAIALLTAVPIAPEEPSTFSRAGEMRSSSSTAPSAASSRVRAFGYLPPTITLRADVAHRCDRTQHAQYGWQVQV